MAAQGSRESTGEWGIALAIVAGFSLLRLGLAWWLPTFTSEAYYWLWGRELAWSYYDHPPMVAVIIGLTSPWLGDSTLGLRIGNVLLASMGSLVFFSLCRRLVGPRAALASLLVLSVAPFFFPFGVINFPDGPLIFFWTISLALFYRAWSKGGLINWLWVGVASAAAVLSKYNGLFLGLAFTGMFVMSDRGREQLRRPGPWVGGLLTLLLIAPNLISDATHGGETLSTPFHRGFELAQAPKHLALAMLLPFGLLTPLVGIAWVRQSLAGLREGRLHDDERFQFLFYASWLPTLAFFVVSVLTEVHAQWMATCVIVAIPLALENFDRVADGPSVRFLRFAVASTYGVFVAVMVALIIVISTVPMPAPGEPVQGFARLRFEFLGWDELRERIHEEMAADAGEPGDQPIFLTSANYYIVSQAEWLTDQRYPAFPLDPGRSNQYLHWNRHPEFLGADALCVFRAPARRRNRRFMDIAFDFVEKLPSIFIEVDGRPVEVFEFYRCNGFKGISG